ncbi:MAG: O-antigen ligase family protein [Verrucomicrobia bacterium]|nr:O-antigen ligase family protein [Verrucomicrobiota bacterium]
MNQLALLFLLAASTALATLPRQWAPLPLLAGACYMTLGQGVELGPFSFTIIRMLIFIGVMRVLIRGERTAEGFTRMDWLMLCWGVWALCASTFHEEPQETLINRLGMVYNVFGVYFLIRCFCQSHADVVRIVRWTAIILAPVALEMLLEHTTHRNLFAVFGGVEEISEIRNGRLRSQGPFAHSILAGTVGAVCAPLMIGLWHKHPLTAKTGLIACLLMVVTSASSGPLASLIVAAFALVLWRWRHLTRQMRIATIAGYILLDLVMKAPAYYLIARIDLVGGSSGYHRAALIESSIKHLREWWFAGTDYTRHWMPTGVTWSVDHTDITNYYLSLGVKGGLPLMVLFILILWTGFRNVGHTLRGRASSPIEDQFFVWSIGASLMAHAATAISVSYFDQSVVFIYLTLALTTSLAAVSQGNPALAETQDSLVEDEPDGANPLDTVACTQRQPIR